MEKNKWFRFNLEKLDYAECFFKHLCACRELGLEYIIGDISSQIGEEKGNINDLIAKLNLVSSVVRDIEGFLFRFVREFMLSEEGETLRVNRDDLASLISQYGHMVAVEEHFADKIGAEVSKLLNVKGEGEKQGILDKIFKLANFLYVSRVIRKKYITGFLETVEAKPVKAVEAAKK